MKRYLPWLATATMTLAAVAAFRPASVKYTMFLEDGTPVRIKSDIQVVGAFPRRSAAGSKSVSDRPYGPLTFRKSSDKASKLLQRAFTRKETLREIGIEVRSAEPGEDWKLDRTVKLGQVRVAKFQPAQGRIPFEQVTLEFTRLKVIPAP